MRVLPFVIMIAAWSLAAMAEEAKPAAVACDEPSAIEKVLSEKGYHHLLDMKTDNGETEQLWTGGQQMVITAEKDKKLCFVATASDVTFNPLTLEKIIKVWQKNQKEL